MTEEILKDKWHDLLFGVRRSARYHVLRRQFFDRLGFITNFLIIITGGGTVIAVGREESHHIVAMTFAALVAIFSAIDLIVGCSRAARDHHDLARDFIELEKKLMVDEPHPSVEKLIAYTAKRLEIEKEEPPKLCALDLLCADELVKAGGYPEDEFHKFAWYHRRFAHVYSFDPCGIKKLKHLKKLESA